MAYQSKHTGAAIDAAIDAVATKEKQWDEKQDKLTGNAGQLVIFDENGNPIAQDMPDIDVDTDNLITLEGGGEIDMAEVFGEGPYVISFTPDEGGNPSSGGGIAIGPDEPTDADMWIDTDDGPTGEYSVTTSFKGRTGDVMPQDGDYTPDQVGAAPAVHTHTPDQVGAVNPNLLDNWYFANPVNQRGGTVVTPGAPYFDESGTQIGTTSAYYTVIRRSTNDNPICSIDGVDRFVSKNYEVPGYVGAGYTIDRWKLGSSGAVLIEDGYISFDPLDGIARNLEQYTEVLLDTGMYTLSALLENAEGAKVIVGVNGGFWESTCPSDEKQVVHGAFFVSGRQTVSVYIQTAKKINIYAIKLELGNTQTLAHQDADGNWVLNEIPDYGEELRKCQRYQSFPTTWTPHTFLLSDMICFTVPTTAEMRTAMTPSNVILNTAKLELHSNGAAQSGFSFQVYGGDKDYVLILATKASHGLTNAMLIVNYGGVIADANL